MKLSKTILAFLATGVLGSAFFQPTSSGYCNQWCDHLQRRLQTGYR